MYQGRLGLGEHDLRGGKGTIHKGEDALGTSSRKDGGGGGSIHKGEDALGTSSRKGGGALGTSSRAVLDAVQLAFAVWGIVEWSEGKHWSAA